MRAFSFLLRQEEVQELCVCANVRIRVCGSTGFDTHFDEAE